MRAAASGIRYSDAYRTIPEGRMTEILLLAGWAFERDAPEALPATREAIEAWIEMGLGARTNLAGERFFDPVEVVNVLKRLGEQGRDHFWQHRYVRTGRRLVTELAANSEKNFTVHFERTFDLRAVAIGKSVRLRAPLPLAGVHGDALAVAPYIKGSPDARLSVSNGRMEARLIARDESLVTLGAELSFPGAGASNQIQIDEAAYLKPQEGLIVVTDRIHALALSLAGPGTTAAASVRAFWSYMLDELICGAIHYDQVRSDAPCDLVLESGYYDCQLGSALFIALCRSRGIPARMVGGHVLYRRAPTNHYWVEVWLDQSGWTPFDFLSWDLSLGGSDLKWRDHFFGSVDARMVTQLLPFEFTGALGVAFPKVWHIVQIAKRQGVEISLAAMNGDPVYSDFVSVSPIQPSGTI